MTEARPKLLVYLGACAVFLIPITFSWVMYEQTSDTFYLRINEDREICLQRSERDSIPERFCYQAALQAREAFSSATRLLSPIVLLFSGMIFALWLGMA